MSTCLNFLAIPNISLINLDSSFSIFGKYMTVQLRGGEKALPSPQKKGCAL